MSASEATRFMDDLQNDPEFTKEMFELRQDSKAVLAKLKEKGYDVTKEEIGDAYLEFASQNMTVEQMLEVSAGLSKTDKGLIGGFVAGGVVVGVGAYAATLTTIAFIGGSAAAAAA